MAQNRSRRLTVAAVARGLLTLLSAVYPVVWYWGREQGLFGALALGMAALWLLRAVWVRHAPQRWLAAIVAAFFVLVYLWRQPQAMYWYPVMMNGLMLLLFGGSLFSGQSLIERLARLQNPQLPPEGVRYTRRVTQCWCGFFVFNGGITLALIAAEAWQAWALYTGVLSYGLMGLLLAGEWLYRRRVLRLDQTPANDG